jgi:hypothetical protein
MYYINYVSLGGFGNWKINIKWPWRRGEVVIASASGTRRPGFISRHVIRFLGKLIVVLLCIK